MASHERKVSHVLFPRTILTLSGVFAISAAVYLSTTETTTHHHTTPPEPHVSESWDVDTESDTPSAERVVRVVASDGTTTVNYVRGADAVGGVVLSPAGDVVETWGDVPAGTDVGLISAPAVP